MLGFLFHLSSFPFLTYYLLVVAIIIFLSCVAVVVVVVVAIYLNFLFLSDLILLITHQGLINCYSQPISTYFLIH